MTANRINNAYAPVSYGGNDYYWGRDVVPQDAPIVCTRPLEDLSQVNLDDVMFQDGTRPTEFAWSCASSEQCCDWTCCPDNGYAAAAAAAVARRSSNDSNPTDELTLSAILSSTDLT
ncbi:hypothetical protein PMAYCL1PPCAC_17337, partial [Pristionchus mayeri]